MKRFHYIFSLPIVILSSNSYAERIERIVGYTANAGGITFQVVSTGCTGKGDFKLIQQTKKTETSVEAMDLTLVRLKNDYCEAAPEVIAITFNWKEVNAPAAPSALRVTNPVSDVPKHWLPLQMPSVGQTDKSESASAINQSRTGKGSGVQQTTADETAPTAPAGSAR